MLFLVNFDFINFVYGFIINIIITAKGRQMELVSCCQTAAVAAYKNGAMSGSFFAHFHSVLELIGLERYQTLSFMTD